MTNSEHLATERLLAAQVNAPRWRSLLSQLSPEDQARLIANESWQRECDRWLREYRFGQVLALRYLEVCFRPGSRARNQNRQARENTRTIK